MLVGENQEFEDYGEPGEICGKLRYAWGRAARTNGIFFGIVFPRVGLKGILNMDYRAEINVPATSSEAYVAITENMSDWWNKMDGDFKKVGDRAKTCFGDETVWEFEAQTLDEPSLIELRCIGACHRHEGLPEAIEKEWLGTILRFKIRDTKDGTSITLTHEGLNNSLLCYDVCVADWNHYFTDSLKTYLGKKREA